MQQKIWPKCDKLPTNVLEITDTAVGVSEAASVRRTPH